MMRMNMNHNLLGFFFIGSFILREPSLASIIKTEHGDAIDCVDIYKQPAFRHPLLKNHTIQKTPSRVPDGWSMGTSSKEQTRELVRLGFRQVCPDGTVPVRRPTVINAAGGGGGSPLKVQVEPLPGDNVPNTYFAAVGVTQKTTFVAATTWMVAYKPKVGPDQSSGSQIWLSDYGDDAQQRNLITAGWSVNPSLYGDDLIHFTTSWASDGYTTGCYDLRCPGFVQVDSGVTLGGVLPKISVPGGIHYDIFLNIFQDVKTKNWWLYFTEANIPIGYWPKEIFSHFENGATRLELGGRVVGQPSPPMGSGFLPDGKHEYSHVGYFTNIEYTDGANIRRNPIAKDTRIFLNCPGNYDVEFYQYENVQEGSNFLYGGPGGQCS